MEEMVLLTPYKDKRSSLIPQSTPIRYRRSSAASQYITPVPLTSALVNTPFARKARVEQLEIEFLTALDALTTMPDSDDESEENAAEGDPLLQNEADQYKELQSRYRLAREKYKTELWNRDFEPVLQRIRTTSAAVTNADLEDSAKSEAVRRLMACGYVVQKEKDVLDGLLGECVRMGAILGDVELFLGALSGTGERYGAWSDGLYGTPKDTAATPTQSQEDETKSAAVDSFSAELLETTLNFDSKNEEGIEFRAFCDHIFTSLQNLHVNSNEGRSPTSPDNNSAASTVSAPLITYLYAAVTEHIAAAQLRSENASLRVAMDRERKQLNAMFAEVQCRTEEDLSLAAGLLIEAVQVQAQVERVRAAARAEAGVSIKIREEIARRKGVD